MDAETDKQAYDGLPCPLCAATGSDFFCRDRRRDYVRCQSCLLVFVPPQFYLTAADEQAEYALHNNDPADAGYRKFLSRLADPLCQRLGANLKGLEFGCGPGPALAQLLEERGHRIELYDHFFAANEAVWMADYDFITATEVVEHLHQPGWELQRLWRQLRPGGYLGLMTKLVQDHEAFSRWHYKNDPTHVCFFSRQTFEWLAEQLGAQLAILAADVILLRKGG